MSLPVAVSWKLMFAFIIVVVFVNIHLEITWHNLNLLCYCSN